MHSVGQHMKKLHMLSATESRSSATQQLGFTGHAECVANLDACHEDLLLCALVYEGWGFSVDAHGFLAVCIST